MKEEDFIKDIFSKTDLNYPLDDLEQVVLKKIENKNVYRKKKRVYDVIGRIGFSCFIILCLLFIIQVGNKENTILLLLGSPFIMLLFMFHLEVFFFQKTTKKYE